MTFVRTDTAAPPPRARKTAGRARATGGPLVALAVALAVVRPTACLAEVRETLGTRTYPVRVILGKDLRGMLNAASPIHVDGQMAAMRSMECVILQDLYLTETAKFAHVFLPGSSSLEKKNGTFTNAEHRVSMVREVVEPLAGLADWQITVGMINAMGYPLHYDHPSRILDEIARLSPAYEGMSFPLIERLGSVQWPCNHEAPEGTEVLHVTAFPRGRANFMLTGYVPTSERTDDRYPLLLTTGRILSQYNVGTQTRRTGKVAWNGEDMLEIHQADADARGIGEGDWVSLNSRYGVTRLRARVSERVSPGVIYTTFHFAHTRANAITSDLSDWATNCPEYKVTAVEVARVQAPASNEATSRVPEEARA